MNEHTDDACRAATVFWPGCPPRDLALRLADALLYPNCGPEELWDEIGDWLTDYQVTPPAFPCDMLLAASHETTGQTKFQTISQSGSAMNLTRLIYSSHHAITDFNTFDAILRKSRENNARDLISGALIISERGFLQLLEGSRRAVGQCFVRIMADQRHQDIQVISCGDVSHRLFLEWSMHLINATRIKREIMENYLVNGAFDPMQMSEFAIEDMCRTLSEGNWEEAA